jgi:hypothetical protein
MRHQLLDSRLLIVWPEQYVTFAPRGFWSRSVVGQFPYQIQVIDQMFEQASRNYHTMVFEFKLTNILWNVRSVSSEGFRLDPYWIS